MGNTWKYAPDECLCCRRWRRVWSKSQRWVRRVGNTRRRREDYWSRPGPSRRRSGGRVGARQLTQLLAKRSADGTPTLLHTYKVLLTLNHLFIALMLSKEDHRRIIYSCSSVKRFETQTQDATLSSFSQTFCLVILAAGCSHGAEVKSKEPFSLFSKFFFFRLLRSRKLNGSQQTCWETSCRDDSEENEKYEHNSI